MTDNERPKKRKLRLEVRLDSELYEQAINKAGGDRNRLLAIVRALLRVWSSGEYPELPDDVIEQELRRAAGGGRKAKPLTTNDSND